VTPSGIDAYLEGEAFFDAVEGSYKDIDLTGRSKRDLERFDKKLNKTADWLRKKAAGIYF